MPALKFWCLSAYDLSFLSAHFGLRLIWTRTWSLIPLTSVVRYKKLGYLSHSGVPHFMLWERGRMERFSLRCLKLATASFISAWWAVFVPAGSTGHPSAHARLCHKDASSVSTMTLSVHDKGASPRELPLHRSNKPKYSCDSFSKIHKQNTDTVHMHKLQISIDINCFFSINTIKEDNFVI